MSPLVLKFLQLQVETIQYQHQTRDTIDRSNKCWFDFALELWNYCVSRSIVVHDSDFVLILVPD